ncbi:LysR family transcriptional regulator [Asticcacaulis sp. 201]|uniref:LysR family transcriptional regulator n=1 Tax=Asticcacaulis sp. 201 TaxID=3028787 RepID=UPI002915E2C1|nr:LysR family transcriptional regulator [Asticcacaulis sp. 201]MDV6329384.1 LysR family transcriptional regulator [Asticcacaulis sp. 201]
MEQQRLDFDDLQAFFLVAETGSFARTAQRLESSKSIISRRVARLEAMLSAKLLQRTARGTHLTEAGTIYYEQARQAMTQLECAAESLIEATTDLAGPIRFTGPVSFGRDYLAPVLAEFVTHYPRIELDIDFSDEKVDLIGDGFDLAVRVGAMDDSSLTARRLCQSGRVVVASPAYLASHPPISCPQDLDDHVVLHYNGVHTQDLWRYTYRGETHSLKVRPHMRSNSPNMLMAAVKAGVGVMVMPVYIAGSAIQSGEVDIVLGDYDWGLTDVSLILPQGRNTTRRVRSLVDFLVLKFHNKFG